MKPSDQALLLYCRPGSEGDCAAEITDRAAALDVAGYCRARPGDAYVLFHPAEPTDPDRLWQEIRWQESIFARQWLRVVAVLEELPRHDRARPIATTAAALLGGSGISALWPEHPDSNEGKALSRFCRRFEPALGAALRQRGVRIGTDQAAPRLHVFFPDSSQAVLALSDPGNSAPWPLGIPRLRLPREAPSRSALKLDEAIVTFFGEEASRRLRPGMTAVDLGAAPGGWSWQLARRGLHVTAVDNGSLAGPLLRDGLVEHARTDGFRYRPPRPVDWLVCDIVEQPHRIARLMGNWLVRGDCGAAIFNLKLPMKQRYRTVRTELDRLGQRLRAARVRHRLACRHLYHDRDEVTVCVERL